MNSISMLRLLLNHEKMTLDIINGQGDLEGDTPLDYCNNMDGRWSIEAKKLFEAFGAKTGFEIRNPLLWQIQCENEQKVKRTLQIPTNVVNAESFVMPRKILRQQRLCRRYWIIILTLTNI